VQMTSSTQQGVKTVERGTGLKKTGRRRSSVGPLREFLFRTEERRKSAQGLRKSQFLRTAAKGAGRGWSDTDRERGK